MTTSRIPNAFRQCFEARASESERNYAADPDRFRGGDWWQLSEAEEEVFAIDPGRWPRMMDALLAYERFKGIVDEFYDDAVVDEARGVNPAWCGEATSAAEFAEFARALAGLSYRESYAAQAKSEFWTTRAGHSVFRDERADG